MRKPQPQLNNAQAAAQELADLLLDRPTPTPRRPLDAPATLRERAAKALTRLLPGSLAVGIRPEVGASFTLAAEAQKIEHLDEEALAFAKETFFLCREFLSSVVEGPDLNAGLSRRLREALSPVRVCADEDITRDGGDFFVLQHAVEMPEGGDILSRWGRMARAALVFDLARAIEAGMGPFLVKSLDQEDVDTDAAYMV